MAGLAFLPWEKWIARLLHPLVVAIRRGFYKRRRQRELAESAGWPQTDGIVQSINWDSSNPREKIVYSFSTEDGYYSGAYWRWFNLRDSRQVRVGDQIALRYDKQNPEKSVFIHF